MGCVLCCWNYPRLHFLPLGSPSHYEELLLPAYRRKSKHKANTSCFLIVLDDKLIAMEMCYNVGGMASNL